MNQLKTKLGIFGLMLLASFVSFASVSAAKPAEKSSIVFVNYGRIVSVKADGSDRSVLTRKNVRVGTREWFDDLLGGDSSPSVSPDGTKLAFVRDFPDSKNWRTQIVVSNRDGSDQTEVAEYTDPSVSGIGWTQEGRLLVSTITDGKENGQEFSDFTYFTLDAVGGDKRVLMSKRYTLGESGLSDEFVWFDDLSTDGKVLYTHSDFTSQGTELRIHDLSSGEDHAVKVGAGDASFAPNSGRIVFGALPCKLFEACGVDAWPNSGLWTVNDDGSEPKRIVRGPGDFNKPEYSPDGKRIVFASTRNYPSGGEMSSEIYSVGTNGGCLTWLTNGSPASTAPSWAPGPLETSLGVCGAGARKPLVELRPPEARKIDARPRLWAGTHVDGRLLSSVSYYIPGVAWESYTYADCAFFNRARCREPLGFESGPVCGAEFGPMVTLEPIFKPQRRRGAVLITSRNDKGKLGGSLLATGDANLFIGETLEASFSAGRPNTVKDQLKLVNNLRRVGHTKTKKLPAPTVRRVWPKRSERIRATYKNTGSLRKTGQALKIGTEEVRFGLQLSSVLRTFKTLRTVKCGKSESSARSFGVSFP